MNKVKSLMLLGMAMVLAACASTPPAPKGPNLTGNWVLTTESPMGSQDTDMVVKQTGDQLAGTISSQMGTVEYKGTLTGGKDVAFGFSFEAQGMSMQIDYKGIVDGDTMKGTAKFGDFGEGAFTAKRKAG
jgi:hypothetical protein